jgi:hypothetical protein
MSQMNNKQKDPDKTTLWAVILTCLIGVAAVAYLLHATSMRENYVAIYLKPDSYPNYLEGNTVKFTYGIQQYGEPSSKYILEVYMGNNLVATRELERYEGENEVELKLPEEMRFPTKVKLVLKTDYGENEVHFWLKGRIEENKTTE